MSQSRASHYARWVIMCDCVFRSGERGWRAALYMTYLGLEVILCFVDSSTEEAH